MSRASLKPASEWQPGQSLVITDGRVVPVVGEHCADPAYVMKDEDLIQGHTSLFPPERVVLVRLLNHARHALCRHAGKTLVVFSIQNLKPLEE